MQTKCACVQMGRQTCTAPSVNGSHTVRRKLKFVGFLRNHKGNKGRRVSCIRLGFTEN